MRYLQVNGTRYGNGATLCDFIGRMYHSQKL